jgi:hypothetical protein
VSAVLCVLLGHRGMPWVAVGAALVLVLPSLWSGLHQDDYILLAVLSGTPPLSDVYPSRLDVFNFFAGPGERMNRMLDLGLLPWWTDPGIHLSFWRPASALTHWADHTLWGGSAAAMHAHSLLWFGALVVTMAWLYRRLLPSTWAAGLAALLYAVDPVHALPVTWIAARSHLVATLLGAGALLAHDRWRRAGWRAGAVAAPALFASALLASESAVGAGAYLVAHAVVLDPTRGWKRVRPLAPYVAIVLSWQLLYGYLGYGSRSDAALGLVGYVSPVHEPLLFLRGLATNAPIMLLSEWGGPSADGYGVLGPGSGRRWLLSVLALVIVAAVLAPLLRVDRIARFWALGQLLALFPTGAVSPGDRYLFAVGIGAMALAARFATGLFDAEPWAPRSRLWRSLALPLTLAFAVIHLAVAPWQLHRAANTIADFGVHDLLLSETMPGDPDIRRQTLVIPHVPSSLSVAYSFYMRTVKGQPIADRTRLLAAGAPVELLRPDAHTLIARGLGASEHIFRPPDRPLRPGNRIALTGLRVEVREVGPDGWPTEIAFRFDEPLDDPSLRWIRWTSSPGSGGRYVPWTPPPVGGSVRVE